MVDISLLSFEELGAIINDTLRNRGIRTTLTGGACAQIYTNNKYVTGDFDFVCNYLWSGNEEVINEVMKEFGFKKKGRIYINDSIETSVEFPPGPLGIGEEYKIIPVEMEFKTGKLSLLSPTDSAKDRLAGYFYGDDPQCLEQAVMICKMNKVDMKDLEKWASNEGRPEKFEEFRRKLKS